MKSKKLISLLCAAALTASSFASLAITASAADTVLYSNNFNGYTNNQMLAVARPGGDMPSAWIDAANGGNELFQALISEETPNNVTFTDANSATVKVQAGEANPDDTGIVYAYEKEEAGDTYISLPKSRFSNKTGGMKLDLSTLKAADGEDFVVSFKAMLASATDGETAAFSIGSYDGTVSLTSSALTADTWGDVRIVVSASGTATLYVNNEEKSSGTVDMTNGMTMWVDQYSGGTKKDDGKYARVNIDDLVVMSAAAGTGATVTVPAAENPGGGTGPVVVQKEAAPLLTAPEGVTPVVNQNFSKSVSITSQTDAEGDTSIDGLKVVLGNVDDNVSSAVTSDYAKGDKVLKLTGGSKSTAGRGPVVSAVDSLELADGNSSVMTFAVNLSSTTSDGAGRLYILQSTRQAGTTNDGEYNAVMAVLATDDYSFVNGDTEVAVSNLEADTWYKVGVVVSSDKYRVWVAKADEDWTTTAQVYNDHVGQGESNLQVTSLPYLAVTSSKASSGGAAPSNLTYSVARIDNMLTYSGTADEPRYLLPTVGEAPEPTVENHEATIEWNNETKKATVTAAADEEAAFDGVLIHAAYYDNGTIKSVKTYDAKNITTDGIEVAFDADDTVYEGDKLMLWSDLQSMVPYGMLEVEDGEEPVVTYAVKNATAADAHGTVTLSKTNALAGDEITVTVTPDENYELDTLTVVDSDNEVVAVTDGKFTMPAKNVTVTATFKAVQVAPTTYTVSGTVDENVDTVALTPETGDAINGTIAEGKVTFAEVPAGTYTITVTAKTGYEVDTIKVADTAATTVTVADADVTTLAITTKQSTTPVTKYTVSGTVDAGVDTVALTPETGDAINGAITEGAVTFAEVPAGTYTVTVTAKEGYKAPAVAGTGVTDGKITVSADVTDLVITTTALANSAVTIDTVENVTIAVKNGEDDVATGTTVQEGTSLKVTATAVAGYEATVKVTKTDDAATEVTVAEDGTFTMPAYPVTVSAVAEYTGKFTITPDATYVNVKDETTSAVNNIGNTPLLVGAAKLSEGKIVTSDSKYDENSTALIFSIDASDYLYKITGAKLKFNATTQNGNNTYFRFWGQFANYIDFENVGSDGITGANLATLGGTATQIHDEGNNVWTYGTTKNATSPIEIDITDALKVDADGKMTMYLTTGTGRMTEVTDLKVEVTAAETNQYNIVNVTSPAAADGTLTVDKKAVVKDDVVTITPVAATGKKITAVKVNGTPIEAADGAYTYTVTGEESAIAVTAEFARADVTTVEISGDANVAIDNGSATYTATVKAGETVVDGTITWSIAAKDENTTVAAGTTISNGVLTIDSNQTAGTIVITASTKKDVANDEDTTVVTATKEVTLVAEAVYTVTKGTETNGTFTVSAATATANDTITVVPTPALGYQVKEVSYTVGGTKTVVNANEGAYTFTGLTGNATVDVEFEAIKYTITNGYTSENNNSIAINVDGAAATEATVEDTVTVVPTVNDGYKLTALTYVADGGEAVDILSAKSFKMPAANVTVNATFEVFDGIYYSEDFEGEIHTFTASHAENVTVETTDKATSGAHNSNFLLINQRSGGEVNVKSPSLGGLTDTVKVSADFRLDPGTSGKTEVFALLGEDNPLTWLDSTKRILTVMVNDTANGKGSLQINGVDVENHTMKDRSYGTQCGLTDATKYQSTGWMHIDATINFETKKVTLKLTDVDDATIADGEYDFQDAAADKLEQLFMHVSKAYAGASLDNVLVTTSWYTGE